MKLPRSAKRTSSTATLSILALAALTGHSYSQALKIGVSFNGRGDGNYATPTFGIDSFAGVDAQQDWNFLGAPFNFDRGAGNVGPNTSGVLLTDDRLLGTSGTSAVTVTATANDSWNSDTNGGGAATPDAKLMDGIIKAAFDANQVGTVTLNGLTVGSTYKMIAYTQMNGGDSTSDWSLFGNAAANYSTFFIRSSGNFDGTFTRGDSADPASRTQGTDYVQWDNVQPSDLGTLTVNWTWRGGNDGAGLAGFQLVELLPPPGDRFWKLDGNTTGTWDLTTSNWVDGNNVSTTIGTNDRANFGNNGVAGPRTVNVVTGGVVSPGIVVDNNAANPYTIGGGPIQGTAKLVKRGVGTLTMNGANDYTGGVDLEGGTLNVATIGDSTAAGALGKAGVIALGTAAGSEVLLNYTGTTATAVRNVVVAGPSNIAIPGGQTLTLTNLSGAGDFKKTGPGNLVFSGTGGAGLTGAIAVQQGDLSTSQIGAATDKALTLGSAGAASLTYGGGNTARQSLTVGANPSTLTVTNANTAFRFGTGSANSGGALTVGGNGRVVFTGPVNFPTLPTIGADATLALQAEDVIVFDPVTGDPSTIPAGNTLPSTITVNAGRLEIAGPSTIGAATPLNLAGGTIRLGHQGLLGQYYTGGGFANPNNPRNELSGTSQQVDSYFDTQTAQLVTARTTTGNRTNLDFSNANYGDGQPFIDQGVDAVNDIKAYFTGKILITEGGNHTFFTRSDDGSGIFIDGVQVVSNNAFQGQTERSGTVNLTPGLHDIQIFYYEGDGGAGLLVEYTPVNGVRQALPNSVLFAGDVYNSTSPVNVTASSKLEIAAGRAELGALTQAANTKLTLNGSANFAGANLTAGTYELETAGLLSNVNLRAISGSGARTINKTGAGNLVFSQATNPAGLSVNVQQGLVVNMGRDNAGVTVDALAGLNVTFNGGGLGLSSTEGNVVYTNAVPLANDFRIEAGRFGNNNILPTTVTYQPASLELATGRTLRLANNDLNYTLNIGTSITGSGAVVVEQGVVNIGTAGDPLTARNLTAPGGLTVALGQVTVSGSTNVGALSLTNNLNGVVPVGNQRSGSFTASGPVTANSVTVNGGTMTLADTVAVNGPITQTAGTLNITATTGTATATSLTLSGGNFRASANVSTPGAVTVSNNAVAEFQQNLTAQSVTLSGTSNTTVLGNLTTTTGAGITVGVGSTLNLSPAANGTVTGNINVNGGNVRATENVDLGTSSLIVAPRSFSDGLLESFIANTGGATDAGTGVTGLGRQGTDTGGIRNSPRMGLTNRKDTLNPGNYWGENETWVYTGQFFDADGIFTFAENIDDRTLISIDGKVVLNNDSWQTATNTQTKNGVITVTGSGNNQGEARTDVNAGAPQTDNNFGMGALGDGWHTVEFRFQGGGGGNGPSNGLGWGGANGADNDAYRNKGIGLNVTGTQSLNGQDYILPITSAELPIFRVATPGTGGSLTIGSGKSFSAAGVTGAQRIVFEGVELSESTLKLHAGTGPVSTAEQATLVSAGRARIDLGAGKTLDIGQLQMGGFAELTKVGPGRLVVSGTAVGSTALVKSTFGNFSTVPNDPSFAEPARIKVSEGDLVFNGIGDGPGGVIVDKPTAAAGGRLLGTGTLPTVTVQTGGTINPGVDGPGTLTVGSLANAGLLELNSGSKFAFELGAASDRLAVIGTLKLDGATLEGSLLTGFVPAANSLYFILTNDGTDVATGSGQFNALAQGGLVTFGGQQFNISYNGDFTTNQFSLAGGNDIVLMAVPEPGTATALLGGLATLLGLQRFRRRSA